MSFYYAHYEFPPDDADPRRRHLAFVQRVFEGYHEHCRRFISHLDREGAGLSKRMLERLALAADRLLGTFAEVIAMLRSWETADGLEAIRLAAVLELVTAVDKLDRQIIARAKVLAGDAKDELSSELFDGESDLLAFTTQMVVREEGYRQQIMYLNRALDLPRPVLSEMDLDVMAWEVEDAKEVLTDNIAGIEAWTKRNPARDVKALAATTACQEMLDCCAEVVRMIAMLRGHTLDKVLVAKPGAATAPVN